MLVRKRYCDICGTEIPEDMKKVRVLCDTDMRQTEYGEEEVASPLRERLDIFELDVCDNCLNRIVSVRRTESCWSGNDAFGFRNPTKGGDGH